MNTKKVLVVLIVIILVICVFNMVLKVMKMMKREKRMKKIEGGDYSFTLNGEDIIIPNKDYIKHTDFELIIGASKYYKTRDSNGKIKVDRVYDIMNLRGTLDLTSWDNPKLLKELIESGVLDVNAKTSLHKDEKTEPILNVAAFFGCVNVFKMLLKHGADPFIKNYNDENAWDAIEEGKGFITESHYDDEEYKNIVIHLINNNNNIRNVYDEMLYVLDNPSIENSPPPLCYIIGKNVAEFEKYINENHKYPIYDTTGRSILNVALIHTFENGNVNDGMLNKVVKPLIERGISPMTPAYLTSNYEKINDEYVEFMKSVEIKHNDKYDLINEWIVAYERKPRNL